MSDLRTIDLRILAEMVECFRGPGFVLQFGDAGFAQFFADEFNVDIEADEFRDLGDSKGRSSKLYGCIDNMRWSVSVGSNLPLAYKPSLS